jgi:hypothetical protein
MTIRNELIDELLAGQDPASVMHQDGLLGLYSRTASALFAPGRRVRPIAITIALLHRP